MASRRSVQNTGVHATTGRNRSLSWRVITSAAAVLILAITGATTAPQASRGATTTTTVAWGRNDFSQLGNGNTSNLSQPAPISGLPAAKQVVSSGLSSYEVTTTGDVWSWGHSAFGALGRSGPSDRPAQVPGIADVKSLSVNLDTAFALTGSGAVFAWGDNEQGKLGTASTASIASIPTRVTGLPGMSSVSTDAYDTVGLSDSGGVYVWGINVNPTQVAGLPAISAVAPHGLPYALSTTGDVWTWKSLQASPTAVKVLGLGRTQAFGANFYDAFTIGTDGRVFHLEELDTVEAKVVPGLTNVKSVVGGITATYALEADGTVWGWGTNYHGELADATTATGSATPLRIPSLSGVAAIFAGASHFNFENDTTAFALSSDGRVRGWGENGWGQLGDGSTITPRTTVAVSGLVGVTSISAGDVALAITEQTPTSTPTSTPTPAQTPTAQPTRPSSATTVKTASYTAVEYIQRFSLVGCIRNLDRNGFTLGQAGLLCSPLKLSQNAEPPRDLSGYSLARWAPTKEYRGLTRIPSYTLKCSATGLASSVDSNDSQPFLTSLGYTKTHVGNGNHAYERFSLGESYLRDGSGGGNDQAFNTRAPIIVMHETYATVSYRWASRIATAERVGQYQLSGYDAPFVWMTFDEKISCSGSETARFNFTNFPATELYINDRAVNHSNETSEVSGFIKQGGRKLDQYGVGNLAFPCRIRQFSGRNPSPTLSTDACQDGKLPPKAGLGGDF